MGQAGGWGASLGAPRERGRGTRSWWACAAPAGGRDLAHGSQPNPGCLSQHTQRMRRSRPCLLYLLCKRFVPLSFASFEQLAQQNEALPGQTSLPVHTRHSITVF